MEKLTVDEAAAEFRKLLQARLDAEPAVLSDADAAETPEDAETLRFRLAEELLRHACGDVARCCDHRCRRSGRCRHLVSLAAQQRQGSRSRRHARRSAGAEAARHAIWVWMNAGDSSG